MKIEVGESLIRSWLRHVEKCEFAELNWKPSPTWPTHYEDEAKEYFEKAKNEWPEALGQNSFSQFLKQAEVDVLGLSARGTEFPQLHLVDIAFHTNGLNYGSAQVTGQKIYKKLVRSTLLAKSYFPAYKSTVYFITPVITNSVRVKVEEAFRRAELLFENDSHVSFQLTLGEQFKTQIFDDVINLSNDVADTSEIFLRSWQLTKPFLESVVIPENVADTEFDDEQITNDIVASVDRNKILIVALYLSRFGHLNLNLGNQTETINQLAQVLGVNYHTLRNYRDRFDRYVDNHRAGWDVPLSEELQVVLSENSERDELSIRNLFKDLLSVRKCSNEPMNQFEDLCQLASDENWCWKLSCSTCGHNHFRAAFLSLSKGGSPSAENWNIHSNINSPDLRRSQIPLNYTDDQLETVLNICTKADLSKIASTCKFPNWLAYMGLILEDLETNLPAYNALSVSWSSQLKEMVSEQADVKLQLSENISGSKRLTISELELCEFSMMSRFKRN